LVRVVRGSSVDEILSMLTRRPPPVDEDGITTIWVTELTNCLYWSYLERVGAEPDKTRMIFIDYVRRLGKMLHASFQSVLQGDTEREVVVSLGDGIVVRGRADLVWRDTVFEFKTYTARRDLDQNLHHLAQLAFYMKHLGARKGMLVYMSRIKPEITVYEVDAREDSGLVEEANRILVERALRYARWLRGEEQPEPEPGPWCNYCPFWRICPLRRLSSTASSPFDPLRSHVQPPLTNYIPSHT